MNFINGVNSSKLVLPGIFNFHDNHNWDEEDPHVIVHSRYQHQFSLNVWAGIIDKFFIGFFFSWWETNRHKVRWFFEHAFTRNIRLRMRFMHDGTPPHFSRVAKQFLNRHFANKWIGRRSLIACSFSGFESIKFSFVGTFKIYSIRNVDWKCWNRIEQGFRQIRETPGMIERESNQMNDKTRASLSSNARCSFRASFVKVIKTGNSLYLINEDR